ncbi:hypothetical protein [Gracilibacillus xinjiangensis]|uniref:Tissue inhibitor of metalloproteinase n=1 Tax=Gracilibacillus xinjiangensis TaxID=1193282 RepID=A0ABV8WXE5_9BACI
MRKRIVFVCIFLSIAVFPIQTKALTCVEQEEPVMDHYDLAVIGTVMDVKKDTGLPIGFVSKDEFKKYVMMEVEESWKQKVPSELVFTADFTWGFNFEKEKKYFIYLNKENGDYYNSPCSPVLDATDELEGIDNKQAWRPLGESDLSLTMWLMFNMEKVVFFGVLLLVIIIWSWYVKKK